jgi:hypothetical protein
MKRPMVMRKGLILLEKNLKNTWQKKKRPKYFDQKENMKRVERE